MVRYLKDGESFGPQHFKEIGNFSRSAVRRASGGPIAPGPSPAASMQPLTRTPTAAPEGGNPLANATVSMPASDLAGLAGKAVKVGAKAALGAVRQAATHAGRGAHINPGGGIETSPAAAAPPPVSQQAVPMKHGGHLSAARRQALPRSDFALPGKGDGPKGAGSGSYPINDASHARNALARVSQHGTPAQKAAVRAKVAAKYPGIGKGSH